MNTNGKEHSDSEFAKRVSGLGHYIWDIVRDRCIQCSKEHASFHGMTVEEYIDQSSTQHGLAHPDDIGLVRQAFQDLRNGIPFQIEYRLIKPDGSICYLREIGHPVFNDAGRVVREIGTSQDITTEVSTRIAIRKNERRYRNLFEQSPVPFMEEDWSAVRKRLQSYGFTNRGELEQYLDDHPHEVRNLYDACKTIIISKNFAKLYEADTIEQFEPFLLVARADPDEIKCFSQAIVSFYFGDRQVSYVADETTVTGNMIATRITFSLPREHCSTWECVLISAENITDELELEKALRKSLHFETIGQISGRVAHDFNNLLTIVRAAAEFAILTEDHSEEILGEIIKASERGAELTSQMLSYAGAQPSVPEIIDVGKSITHIRTLFRSALGTNIQFIVKVSEEGLLTCVDAGLLSDAIMNLLINSRDAMPEGGILTISAKTKRLKDPSLGETGLVQGTSFVCISVADTGNGMSPRTLEKSTEPFFTTKENGTGLGLASVHGFARQSAGLLQIESSEGVGTTVSMLFPAVETSQVSPQ